MTMCKNAESPGVAIPGLSQTIGTGLVEQAAGAATTPPRGQRGDINEKL